MEVELGEFHAAVHRFQSRVDESDLSGNARYETLSHFDPFDGIPPALLGAGHIAAYAIAASMIEPFSVENLTKPASYLVTAGGPCRYKNENGLVERFYLSSDPRHRDTELQVRDSIRLAPNSVCFVTLEPIFKMPAYLGARFNLLIRDVYRGLLVGTGPLVDPGFCGRLSIPLHNFTNKEYFIEAGEGLVYFEFTKLSWCNPGISLDLDWVPRALNDRHAVTCPSWLPIGLNIQPPFPASKNKRRGLDDYLKQATGGGPPQSAIGLEITKLKKHSKQARKLLGFYSLGGVVTAVILFFTAWSLYNSSLNFVASAQTELRKSNDNMESDIVKLRNEIDDFHSRIKILESSTYIEAVNSDTVEDMEQEHKVSR